MHFLHAAARTRGATQVRLKVYHENVPAGGLYESLGYRFQPTAAPGELLGTLSL